MSDNYRIDEFKAQVEAAAKELNLVPTADEVKTAEVATSDNDVAKPAQETVATAPEYTEEETKAMETGWDPNFQGDNRVSAKEFLRVGQIIEAKRAASKKADLYQQEVQELTKTVRNLVEHNKQIEKASYEKALRELNSLKREAISEGNVEKVEDLENQARILQHQVKAVDITPPTQELRPEARAFIDKHKNSWFNTETEENANMAKAASAYEQYELENSKSKSYEQILKETEDFIKYKFPHRFENPNKDRPAAVMKSTSSSNKGTTSLSLEQRQIFNQIQLADPNYSINDFIKQVEIIESTKK